MGLLAAVVAMADDHVHERKRVDAGVGHRKRLRQKTEGIERGAHGGGAGVADLDRRRLTVADFAGDGFRTGEEEEIGRAHV